MLQTNKVYTGESSKRMARQPFHKENSTNVTWNQSTISIEIMPAWTEGDKGENEGRLPNFWNTTGQDKRTI